MLVKHTSIPEVPRPGPGIALALTFVIAISICSETARADGTAQYSYRQDNLDANSQPVIYQKSVGPVPQRLDAMEQTPNSSFRFDVSGVQTGPTSLATRAALNVDVDHLGRPESWSAVMTRATADASLVDFATVQGPISANSGTVVFSWALTGVATLSLDTSNFDVVEVIDLSASATLNSTIPGSMGSLLDESYKYPKTKSSNELWQRDFGVDSGALTFDVPWQIGMEMPVFFDLSSTANLDISNLDASGFKAGLDIDLANTAVLSGVSILDESGAPLHDARLVSRDGFEYPASLPEPSSQTLLLWGLIFSSRRLLSRRRSA